MFFGETNLYATCFFFLNEIYESVTHLLFMFEVKRRIERMISICLIGYLIGWFRRTQYITSIGLFYKNVGILQECKDFNWRMFYCEELVGGFTGDDGVGIWRYLIIILSS